MADPKVTEHLDKDPNDPRNRDYTAEESNLNDPVQGGGATNPKSDQYVGDDGTQDAPTEPDSDNS